MLVRSVVDARCNFIIGKVVRKRTLSSLGLTSNLSPGNALHHDKRSKWSIQPIQGILDHVQFLKHFPRLAPWLTDDIKACLTISPAALCTTFMSAPIKTYKSHQNLSRSLCKFYLISKGQMKEQADYCKLLNIKFCTVLHSALMQDFLFLNQKEWTGSTQYHNKKGAWNGFSDNRSLLSKGPDLANNNKKRASQKKCSVDFALKIYRPWVPFIYYYSSWTLSDFSHPCCKANTNYWW